MSDDLEARAVAWLRIEESKSQFDMVSSPEDQFRHRAAMFAAFARHVLAGVDVEVESAKAEAVEVRRLWDAEIAKLTIECREAHEQLPFSHKRDDGKPDPPYESECPTFYDGCHCSVATLRYNIERAEALRVALEVLIDQHGRVIHAFADTGRRDIIRSECASARKALEPTDE